MAPVNKKTILLASFLGVSAPLFIHGCGGGDDGPRDDPQDDPSDDSDDPNEPVPDPDVPEKIELPDWIASLNCTVIYDTANRIFVKPQDDGGGFTKADITKGLPSLLASLDFDPIGSLIAWLLQMALNSEGGQSTSMGSVMITPSTGDGAGVVVSEAESSTSTGPWPLIEQYIPTMYKYFIDNLNDNTFQSIIVFVWTPFVNAVNDQTPTGDGNETTGDVILKEFNTAVQAAYNSTEIKLSEFLDVCKEEYFNVFSVYADVFLRSVGGFPQWRPKDVIDGLDCNKTNALLWLYTDTSKYPSDNCYISNVTLPGKEPAEYLWKPDGKELEVKKVPRQQEATSSFAENGEVAFTVLPAFNENYTFPAQAPVYTGVLANMTTVTVLPVDIGADQEEEELVFSYLESDFTPDGDDEDDIPVVQYSVSTRAPGLWSYARSRVTAVTIAGETTPTLTIKKLTEICSLDNGTNCDKASFTLFGKFVGASYVEGRLVVTPGYENDNCAGDWPGNDRDTWQNLMPQALKAFYFGEYPKLRTILVDNIEGDEVEQAEAAGALNVTATMTSDEIDKNVHTAIEKLWSENITDKLQNCLGCPAENPYCCYENLSESDLWEFPRKPTANKFDRVWKEEYMLYQFNMELNKVLDELISVTGEVKNDTDYTCKPDDITKLQTTLTEEWGKATPSYPKPLEPEGDDGTGEDEDEEGDGKQPAKKALLEAL